MNNDRITSTMKYFRCDELFGETTVWKNVPEIERREVFEDSMVNLATKEKERAKALRKRNTNRLTDILDRMTNIKYNTTWEQAQQMLLDNPSFADDDELLAMDKEDALVCFEEHIREMEKEEEAEKEKEKKRTKRLQRKNRDAMNGVLDELHEQGKLTSMSLWVELYPIISQDARFHALLGQPGSTPLDLFKFYVEDLKNRFSSEKKLIKDILSEKSFAMTGETTFEEFATVVCEDKRSASLDAGNVKLTYNALLEKAEVKEKEVRREEGRRVRKVEGELRQLLQEERFSEETSWSEVVDRLGDTQLFKALGEDVAEKMFKDYQRDLAESCGHNHGKRKNKKSKKKKKVSSSDSDSEQEERRKKKKKRDTQSDSSDSDSDSDNQ